MQVKNFLVMLLAIVIAVIYAYFALEERPEKAVTATPKDYIELIEGNDVAPTEQGLNK